MIELRETRIRDNVRTWTLGGESMATSYGSNATAVAGKSGVLLVDPFITPAHARLLERAVRAMTPVPVRFVLLTHHHTDHALGAGYFAAAGTEVIAHRPRFQLAGDLEDHGQGGQDLLGGLRRVPLRAL